MKNKKKVELVVFICFVIGLFLYSCDKRSIDNSRTIILNVDTDIVPNFSSNYGHGEYNQLNKTYTHNIDDLKDVYIYLSYKDLCTKTISIKTSQMRDKNIYLYVDYNFEDLELYANIYINVSGIKDLNSCSFSLEGDSYNDLMIFDKNTLCFTTNTRKENLKYTLRIDDYKAIDINLSDEEMKTGIYYLYTTVIEESQRYVCVKSSVCSYELFDKETNKLIKSGNFSNSLSYNFIIIPDERDYYVKVNNVLYQVPSKDNLEIIPKKVIYNDELTELRIDGFPSNECAFRCFIDFKNQQFINSLFVKKNMENYGLIYSKYNGEIIEYFYFKSFKEVNTIFKDKSLIYYYNKNDFTKVNVNFKNYDLATGEIIESTNKDIFEKSFILENNEFTVINRDLRNIKCRVELLDKAKEKIGMVNFNLSVSMLNHFYSGIVKYNYKNVPFSFPIFIEDIEYDSERDIYIYPNQFVDTNCSLVSLSIIKDGCETSLKNESLILYDEEANIIRPTKMGENYYYELNANKVYKVSYGETIEFEVNDDDFMLGNVCINAENRSIIDITIPDGYTIETQDDLSNSIVMMDECHYKIVKFVPGKIILSIGNKNVYFQYELYVNGIDNKELIFEPFYCFKEFKLDYLQSSTGKVSLQHQNGSDGFIYSLANPLESDKEVSSLVFTINKGRTSFFEKYILDVNSIIYDESLQANTYDMHSLFDYKLIIRYDYYCQFSNAYSDSFFIYANEDTILIIDDNEYLIKDLNLAKGKTYVYTTNNHEFIEYYYYFFKVANPHLRSLTDETYENKLYMNQYTDLLNKDLTIFSFYAPATITPFLSFKDKDGDIKIEIHVNQDYYEVD